MAGPSPTNTTLVGLGCVRSWAPAACVLREPGQAPGLALQTLEVGLRTSSHPGGRAGLAPTPRPPTPG